MKFITDQKKNGFRVINKKIRFSNNTKIKFYNKKTIIIKIIKTS